MAINAKEFYKVSKDIFYPIYPVIAEDIINRSQINTGICMDIGGGTGYLGMSIAEKTNMNVCIYDISKEILDIAQEIITSKKLDDKVWVEVGSAENINRKEESIDLITSRGSIYFWQDKVKGLNEIYRVLRKGGYAYIGGGFGNEKLAEQIDKKMLSLDSKWFENKKKRRIDIKEYENILKDTIISDYKIIEVGKGLWITFTK